MSTPSPFASADAINPQQFLQARGASLLAWGVKRVALREAAPQLERFDGEQAGSWATVWRSLSKRAEARGDQLGAALNLGVARLSLMGTPSEVAILAEQRRCFIAALSSFATPVEQRVISIGGSEATAATPVYYYPAKANPPAALILLSGGLDTYKVELHQMAVKLARATGYAIATVDMPGTGETPVPLTLDAHQWYRAMLDALPAAGTKGVIGVSFAGYWAAKLALTHQVDFAVDLGGPVDARNRAKARLDEEPPEMRFLIERLIASGRTFATTSLALLEGMSMGRHGDLDVQSVAPLLVLNGCDDPYVDREDTTVFRNFAGAKVVLLARSGHCSVERPGMLGTLLASWLLDRVSRPRIGGLATRAVFATAARLA